MVGSTRVRRSERAAPATARDGGSSVSSEDASASALAAAQLGRRAVQLSRVLGVANRGMGYQPPSEWMNQFRGVAATEWMNQLCGVVATGERKCMSATTVLCVDDNGDVLHKVV
eukprot:1142872-Pelagomonas_calceolata.AAC.2